ncbi:MAG TPA: glycoside hydrolase domain-containing protein [Gemmatimonadales bacterium]|jgi:hypothetical protein|nr:glycoside hydrolase domain-containing protein [Gemmatimonadales bacterium]
MRRILEAGCLLCLVATAARGQAPQRLSLDSVKVSQRGLLDPTKVPHPRPHFEPEYTFDRPTDPGRWSQQKKGLNVSFASTDHAYLRSEVPDLRQDSQVWEATGWRGERLNGELVIWSPDTLQQIRLAASDLVSAKGDTLRDSNLHLYLVRYVVSNYPYNANEVSCGGTDSNPPYLMPDRLEPADRFDLPGNSVRPIWLSLDIPPGTPPGRYQGTVDVSSAQGRATLRTQITVQPQTLPPPHDWKFRLDLWQNPWVVAWYYHVEPWSAEHKALLRNHLALYANAGGTYITTYAVHSPWSDNSYMIEGSMIEWTKRADGTWKFDYNIFDDYVQLAMAAGVDRAITVYTPLPWGNRFRYLDEKSGNYVYESWAPDSAQFGSVWNAFLTDLKGHLEQRGWFDRTYLGINENEMPFTLAAIRVIRAHSPKWKITYAGNWHAELDSLLDDYSPIITAEPSQPELKARTARGRTTTYYLCCTPQKPNTFVFSPPIEGRYIGWYAMAYGYDGFLRWAYDAWPADPVRDARHSLWPAGDEFMVYPGGGSSVRFEKMREGIVDYEKIRILRDLASRSTNRDIQRQMRTLDDHLRTFVGDRDYYKRTYDETRITDAVQKGLRMLEALSDRLAR